MERPSMEPTCLPAAFSLDEDIRLLISASLADRGRERWRGTTGNQILGFFFFTNFIPVIILIVFKCQPIYPAKAIYSRHLSQKSYKSRTFQEHQCQDSHSLSPTIARSTPHWIRRPNFTFSGFDHRTTPQSNKSQHSQLLLLWATQDIYVPGSGACGVCSPNYQMLNNPSFVMCWENKAIAS